LNILETTGFTYESGLDSTLALLENAGAFVDRKADRIYFPRDIILEQAAKAPAQVILYSRDGQNDLNLTEDRVHLGTGGAAIHQLSNHIEVPNYNSSGLTDSKIPDAQAGWEKAATTLLAAMGGSNFVHHAAGMLESMLTVAYEQFVIDD
jgi:trimethylamine--corrinoid protein Co-methyltransferase